MQVASPAGTSFTDNTASADNAYEYQVRAIDTSGNASNFSNTDLTTTATFADDPLNAGATIRAQHISDLRDAVDVLRTFAGMTTVSWTDPALFGITVQAMHIEELRGRLTETRTFLGYPSPTYTDEPIQVGITTIKQTHITEIRTALR